MAYTHKSGDSLRHVTAERLWETFMMGIDDTMQGHSFVIRSWERCRSVGVDPTVIRQPPTPSEDQLRRAWQELPIARELEPWVQHIESLSVDAGYLVVVGDATGRILRIAGDPSIRTAAERMHFREGALWAEGVTGTNAIGTALATGAPVEIVGAEHFVQVVHPWTCAAAPILDPATGKPLAVLDLTGLREKIHPFAMSLVRSVVAGVEERLRVRLQLEHSRLLEHYVTALASAPADLLVLTDRSGTVVRASTAIHEEGWIDRDGRLLGLPQEALHIQGFEWEAEGRRGRRMFAYHPIYQGAVPIGALIHVRPVRSPAATLDRVATRYSFQSIVGDSLALKPVLAAARTAAATDLPILIQGESGTGKELLVQAIHTASPRASGPFITVNCGAIPKDLLASEFFGYEGGAFTGSAREGRAGKFQQANGGTIFLDEIGEMPLDAQVHLLRVLEEGEVIRVGGHKPIKLNVRVIAATNQDLTHAIRTGVFRSDLYYRLNVVSFRVPPLRERTGDVALLARWFLNQAALELHRRPLQLSEAAREELEAYDWPGNIRELRNMMYRITLTAPGPQVEVRDLPAEVTEHSTRPVFVEQPAVGHPVATIGDQELALIRAALREANGNVALAAQRLGIHRSTIYRKLKQL